MANLRMPSLTLVADVKAQALSASPARDLYLSRWFRLCRAYALNHGDWRILSSEHGLLHPDQTIEPYEPRKPRASWYEDIVSALLEQTETGDTLILLSMARHREALGRPLSDAGRRWSAPLDGLDLSQQVAWLEAELEREGVRVPGSRERSEQEKKARRERRAARRKG